MSVLVVAQSSLEIPEGLMNNSVYLLALANKRRYIRTLIAYYQHGTCHTVTLAALLFETMLFCCLIDDR